MARAGEAIENPITKERFVWRQTARETQGALLQFDLYLGPGAKVAAPHVHPQQEERFVIHEGHVRLMSAGQVRHLVAGDTAVVPAGTPHAWWNEGAESAHATVDLRPALDSEKFFETFCGLARDGKANPSTGMPAHPLQLAVLFDTYKQEFAFASAWQRALFNPILSVLAPIGYRRGFRSQYPTYSQ